MNEFWAIVLVLGVFFVVACWLYNSFTVSDAHARMAQQEPNFTEKGLKDPVTNNTSVRFSEAYQYFGVSPDADANKLKEAYRSRVRQLHPDLHPELGDEPFKNLQEVWQRLTSADNDSSDSLLVEAQKAASLGDLETAKSLLRQLLSVREDPEVFVTLANVMAALGDSELGADYLFLGYQKFPTADICSIGWAGFLAEIGDAARALPLAEQVFSRTGPLADPTLTFSAGSLLLDVASVLNRHDVVCRFAPVFLRLYPEHADAHAMLCVSSIWRRDFQTAMDSAEVILDLVPDPPGEAAIMLVLGVVRMSAIAGFGERALWIAEMVQTRSRVLQEPVKQVVSMMVEATRRLNGFPEIGMPQLSCLVDPTYGHRLPSTRQRLQRDFEGLCFSVGSRALESTETGQVSTQIDVARNDLAQLERTIGEYDFQITGIERRKRPEGLFSRLADSGSAFVKTAGCECEFEGPYVAADLGLGDEALGGQRAGHAAIELPDGRVVVIGGARLTSSGGIEGSPFANFIDTVEIFDPFTGYWTLVRDSAAENVENVYGNFVSPPMQLSVPRAFLTATYIGNYQILVVGGFFDAGDRIDPSTATEIIDLSKGTIETLDEGFAALQRARGMHTAHLVDGRVFIVGGVGGTYDRPSFQATQAVIEVYDPSAGYFDFALDPDGQQLSLLVPRGLHTGTSLPDGIVITGGRVEEGATDTIEFFEFNSGAGELSRYVNDAANLPRLSSPRFGHSAILMEPDFSLPSAEAYMGTFVAVVGGYTSVGESSDLLFGEGLTTSIQFFDTWELTTVSAYDTDLATARAYCQVAETSIMRDLLVMGGYTADGVTTSSERFMRTSEGGFPVEHVSFASFRQPRAFGSVSRINTHNILFVGGWDGGSSGVSCGQDTITAGCTSELANPGELYYLGYQYVD